MKDFFKIKNKIFLFFLFLSLSFSSCQIIKNITLGEAIKGTMELDESHEYFRLIIPEDINNKVLVFTTKQESEDLPNDDDTYFSDPDFYVSKINKYPSSRLSSEWYSQRYGADIVTVPSGSVHGGDVFYIGMYCQFKCRYYLNSYTTIEITISPNIGYVLNIKPGETGNLKLPIKNEFNELKVIIHYRQRGKIRVFMSKDSPSTQNSFNVVPSWIYGYSIIVKKDTKEYCTNCDYHIFIKNEGTNTIFNLLIMPIFQKERFVLRKNLPLYETMDQNTKRCYSYPVSKDEKQKEKLIVQITMYSGKIDVFFEGWEPKQGDLFSLNEGKTENLMDEKFFLIDKKNFEKYDNDSPDNKGKDSNLNFCIRSQMESSFIISTYFLTKLIHFQQFRDVNILLQGNSKRGYLLKDQVFKYDLVGLNLDKSQYNIETNITITIKNIAGKVSAYGHYCENERCIYTLDDLKKLSHELIKPKKEDIFSDSKIEINNKNNFCLKKGNQIVPAQGPNIHECLLIVLLHCNETDSEGLCIYDIQINVQDEPILMKPRQMYYGIIPIKKFDSYEIIITDEKIYSLVIVLNTESGDAELKILKAKTSSSSIGLISLNDDYLPDVIRLTPWRIREENLVGKYVVKVFSKTFSTYHLYYYTMYKNENNTQTNYISNVFNSEVTMNLKIGEIITDYFPIDIRYKVYSFQNILSSKENIKIFMNKVNIGFNIYVYKDLSKFQIKQIFELIPNNSTEPISGYIWKSNANNEINLDVNDPEYSLNTNYYIIIAPILIFNHSKIMERQRQRLSGDNREFNYIEVVSLNATIKYYLGISTENTPLMVSEGIPHTMTLNNGYNGQLYYYLHFDINKNFHLIINVLFGEIDIYIDVNKIDIERIKSLDDDKNYDSNEGHYKLNSMHYYKNIKSFNEISLSSNYFKTYLPKEENAKIFFYIKRSEVFINNNIYNECQYTIVERSSEKKEEMLIPGETRTSIIPLGKRKHFVIEEVKRRKYGNINVFFKNGYGNVYVRIPKKPETDNKRFPNEAYYEYIGETIYSGKAIFIPKEVYDRIDSTNFKLQILVTVVAETGAQHMNSTSDVTFSINYSNEPKRINQNEPYDGYIKKGELQYFTLYFDSYTENIYIGLSNMKGDADMFLNYGEMLPTSKKYNWNSNQVNHEFIDIGKNDDFFKKQNVTSLQGVYTLLIVGYIDTSYTLFVSNHKNIIFPLRNNKQVTCYCENEDDKCLFRYTDVFMEQNKEYGINYNEVIFTTNYLYGNGIMYTKVIKDDEIHNIKDINKTFPDKDNYDVSNKESKQRNYLKIQIKEEKYTEDTNILMTFVCSEKTKVDITSTSIRYFQTTDFIEENKENYYYLGYDPNSEESQSDITLFFYNYDKKKDLIYSIHSYVGDAHIVVYSNNSWWDVKAQKILYDYQEINTFDINSYNEQNSINGFNPFHTDYHNVLLTKDKEKYDNIIFKITPKNKFSFYIQCNYDKNFMEIPFGKMKSYFAKNNEFYGYFDITEEYSDIELSVSLEKNLKMNAELYVKINVIDNSKSENVIKKNDQSVLYVYSVPSEKNYDYKMATDKTLGTISLNMRNFPKLKDEEKKNKFIRGLFYIVINKKEFVPTPNDELENKNDINNKENEAKEVDEKYEKKNKDNEEKALINILLIPGINNFKQVKANPYVYYFSNLTYDSNTHEKVPETKIWELTKDKVGHDIMVIEISSCSGEYTFKIQDHLITGVNNDVSVNYYDKKENGKHTIYVDNLKSNHYYLSIEARESDLACKMKNDTKSKFNCGNDLAYMMYYYTDYEHSVKFPKIDKFLTYTPYGNGKIKIELPDIITRDINDNVKDINDFKFDVFATRKKEYFDNLGNVCFLSRFVPNENTVFYLEDMKVKNKKALVISGLGYRNQYYIGILVQNVYTRELIAFDPIVVWSGGYLPYPLWKTILTNVLIVGLIIAIIIYCKKYRKVKVQLKEIKGEALPKNELELPSVGMTQNIRYSGLGESY